MRNVERIVLSCSWIARRSTAWLCALWLCSCNSSHTQGSTETGNPPVIDVDKIALVVSSDGVKIVGEAGAVTPGGATVELQIVGSDQVARGSSKPDGSFEIALGATENAVVEVSAVSASDSSQRSSTIYVTRGGATVGTGQGAQLSCMQRSNLASQAIGDALERASDACQTVDDCELIPNGTSCTDSCSDALIAKSAAPDIERTLEAIDRGLCADFAADGCSIIALPCTPMQVVKPACIAGQCQFEIATEPSCPPNSRFVQDVCTACGAAGGCVSSSKCAIVCSEPSNCPSDPPGTTCSSRGICEATQCD